MFYSFCIKLEKPNVPKIPHYLSPSINSEQASIRFTQDRLWERESIFDKPDVLVIKHTLL